MANEHGGKNGIFIPYDQFGRICYALAHAKTTMYDEKRTLYEVINILASGGDPGSTQVISVNGKNGEVTLTAKDLIANILSNDSLDPTYWKDVKKLGNNESYETIFTSLSSMFSNIRYLYKLLGDDYIDGLGEDITIAEAISDLESRVNTINSSIETMNSRITLMNATLTTLYDEMKVAKWNTVFKGYYYLFRAGEDILYLTFNPSLMHANYQNTERDNVLDTSTGHDNTPSADYLWNARKYIFVRIVGSANVKDFYAETCLFTEGGRYYIGGIATTPTSITIYPYGPDDSPVNITLSLLHEGEISIQSNEPYLTIYEVSVQ